MHEGYNKCMQYIAIQLKGDIMEVWKDIQDYEGLYQVSNLGQVRSLKSEKIRILKPRKIKGGYLRVALRKNNMTKDYLVHRLVTKAFVPNPNDFPEVNHKNEVRDCNVATNLEWCTRDYNNNYGNHNKKVAVVQQMSVIAHKDNKEVIFDSLKQAGEELHICPQNICRCLKGRTKTAKGYSFRYAVDRKN